MATYTQVPGLLNIKGVVGADFSCNLDFNVSLAAYTFDAGIVLQEYPTKRIQPITVTVNDAPNGLISLTLTDAETTAIGPISNKKWYLDWMSGVTKNTIISGKFELSDIPIGQAVETNNDVIVETPEVTVTLTSLTGAAININATNDTTTNASFYPVFVAAAGSGQTAKVSTSKLSFNPSSGNLSATAFTGNLTGNVTGTASNATTSAAVATTATTTNAAYYIPFVSNATNQSAETVRVSSSPTFNPSTNTLSSPVFSGTLTGTASSANAALTATINNDNSTNREFFPVFAYQSTGASTTLYGSSAKLKFNPSNGYFTASGGFSVGIAPTELRDGGIYYGNQTLIDFANQIIYDYSGQVVSEWGANGMYVTGTASKDVPLRLMDTTAGNLATGSYIIVRPSASATTNGTELRNAYAAAKTFTPNSLALSATNRATVLLLPGRYDLVTTPLTMDTEFVDLVGLSEEPKHVFITSQVILSDSGTIVQTADNVIIRNVSIDRTGAPAGSGAGRTAAYFPNRTSTAIQSWTSNGTLATVASNGHGLQSGDSVRITGSGNTSFDGVYTITRIDDNSFTFPSTVNSSGLIGTATERFDDTYIENCRFSGTTDSGMRGAVEYAGTYRRCVGEAESFAGAFLGNGSSSAIASGLFEDCTGGAGSFGRGTASGTFTRCTGGAGSFNGTASGIFTDCSASSGFGTASGTFLRCSVSNGGFGSNFSTATGTLTDCTLRIDSSLGYLGTFTGTMRRCRFVVTLGNASPLRVGAGAKIFDSTLIATGTGNSITAGSAVTISLAGCRMNRDVNANVSNNLGTLTESYNLIDADID